MNKTFCSLEELRMVSINAYMKVIEYFKREVGATSEEAVIRYTKQTDYVFTNNGEIYRRVN